MFNPERVWDLRHRSFSYGVWLTLQSVSGNSPGSSPLLPKLKLYSQTVNPKHQVAVGGNRDWLSFPSTTSLGPGAHLTCFGRSSWVPRMWGSHIADVGTLAVFGNVIPISIRTCKLRVGLALLEGWFKSNKAIFLVSLGLRMRLVDKKQNKNIPETKSSDIW